MDTKARTETVRFLSTEGNTNVRGILWWPEQEPRGVVQLVHGMAEHIMRYEQFAHLLNEHGFLVCGHDHLGHGESVRNKSEWGCLPARTGRDILVSDVGLMRGLACDHVGTKLPYFLFGHSMGSFVVRAYIAECGQELSGAIICGTGHIAPAMSAGGNRLARIISRVRGENHISKLLGNLSVGAYAKAIPDARTPLDWLSYNQKNVDEYIADEQCGFAFSAGGNATLTALTREVCSPACFERMPKDLPLLFVAGDADPVGDAGKGVLTTVQMARDAGITDVTCTIYQHMRHEILNESDGKRVMTDIEKWIEEHI